MKQVLQQALARTSQHSDSGVERILEKKLNVSETTVNLSEIWTLADYGLDQVTCVQTAPLAVQAQLREQLALSRLQEAWSIEKAGMCFAAKMSLLAETINEQKLYSLFAAEEARHFHFIDQTLGERVPSEPDPFIGLLNEMIISAGRQSLQFLVQVVLEGWGIEHYAMLQQSCQDAGLKTSLRKILVDEAAHHGSGLALFKEAHLSRSEREYILEMMNHFLGMVQIGPVSVLQILETQFGGWAPGQRAEVLEQMQARQETERKLKLLESFLIKAKAERILDRLQRAGAFLPHI